MKEDLTFRFPQGVETDPSVLTCGHFRVRFAYARSRDTQKAGDSGQDYLALRTDGHRLAFVLCDGVSQSFFGDLAARFLGDRLLDWLWTVPDRLPGRDDLARQLDGFLRDSVAPAAEEVKSLPLPTGLPDMVRDVLEKKRILGSETMFLCGRVDCRKDAGPDGSLVLAWLGDSRLQLWEAASPRSDRLMATWGSEQRWSTLHGARGGRPGVFVGPLGGLDHVVGYSDGFIPVEDRLAQAGDADLAGYLRELNASAASDDVSLLDLTVVPRSLPTQIPLIAPQPPEVKAPDPEKPARLAWSGVPGADAYEVEWGRVGETMARTRAKSPPVDLGTLNRAATYRFRIRPTRGMEAGPWSAWSARASQPVKVPRPPEPAPREVAVAAIPSRRILIWGSLALLGLLGVILVTSVFISGSRRERDRQERATAIAWAATGTEAAAQVVALVPTEAMPSIEVSAPQNTLAPSGTPSPLPTAALPAEAEPDLGIGSTMVSPVDGMMLVLVPAGEFLMGSTGDDPGASADETPQHVVYLDAFWIDQTEVTNAMYARCVAAGACAPPEGSPPRRRDPLYGNAAYDHYPVLYVDWDQSRAYCEWAGRRLPTEAEWEKAARGTEGSRTYSWGEGIDCTRANYHGCAGDTTRVGSYPAGASPYGALDMAGNVWEWVADWYDEGYYAISLLRNPTGSASGQSRVLRGGSWNDNPPFLRAAERNGGTPAYGSYFVGIRCALGTSP